MLAYLLRRLGFAITVLFTISFASFWVLAGHIIAIYPLLYEQPQPVALIRKLTVLNHLDKPIPERYWLWLKGLATGGDGRRTVLDGTRIWPSVLSGLAHTAELAAGALVVALLLSVAMGVVAAARSGRPSDRLLRAAGYFTWSTPVFVTAFVLQGAFIQVDTRTGFRPFFSGGLATGTGFAYVLSWYRHMTLPIVAVALSFIGLYSRYIRAGMLVTLNAPYSTVARAKGLTERRVFLRHALRNALIPFFAVLTLDFSGLVGATLVADVIFGVQGLGSLFFGSIFIADPFQLEAILIVTVLVVVAFGFLADAVYPLLDPRIRLT